MKNCVDCKAELPDDAEFCHKCGVPVTSQAARAKPPRKPRTAPSAEQLAKSMAERAAIEARILTETNAKTRRAATFFVVASAILALFILTEPKGPNIVHFVLGFAIMGVSANLIGRGRWLTAVEYYSISGSHNADDSHRCIFCGHPGIYTQGEYAGNTKYAQCSKCKNPLFSHH